ncbi:hypothetical protein BJY52DRAFT_1316685, partial [Lactarius psammicola]
TGTVSRACKPRARMATMGFLCLWSDPLFSTLRSEGAYHRQYPTRSYVLVTSETKIRKTYSPGNRVCMYIGKKTSSQ